jgi:hypothetical protein
MKLLKTRATFAIEFPASIYPDHQQCKQDRQKSGTVNFISMESINKKAGSSGAGFCI